MDNRVKERLTGALILVAAGVILVPEIFSGRPHPADDPDAPAAAPASEGPPLRSYTAELGQGPAVTRESATEAATPVAPAPSVTAPPPVPVERPVSPSPAPVKTPAPPPAAPASEVKPPPTPPPSRPAPASSIAPPATAAHGGWYVQVGGFSQPANAERLASQLRAQGFGVSVVPPGNGNKLTRVRVGPAPDRAAAAELQKRLQAAGQAGSLVAP